jgi:hypothetical protein
MDRPPELRIDGGAARTHICDRCGSEMVEHHCKIRCPNCGYVRDCSDPRAGGAGASAYSWHRGAAARRA